MARLWVVIAGASGAMAVGFAAYGAHGIDGQAADWIRRGSNFQLIHAGVLLILGLAPARRRSLDVAGMLFVSGIILFSGSLYAMALALPAAVKLVPVGGSCFIAGWIAILVAGLTASGSSNGSI